jgi:hypothetical protein
VNSVPARRRRYRLASAAAGVLAAVVGAVLMIGNDPAAASNVNASAVDLSALDRVQRSVWQSLSQKTVFFGHQSVGADIVAGLQSIVQRKPELGLRVVESRDPLDFNKPGFYHAKVGTNESCDSKLIDFASILKASASGAVDIAFVKFCYVDLTGSGDPVALFRRYQEWATTLAAECPKVNLVHSTIPVGTVEAGIKARVKRLLGRTHLGGYQHNLVRQRYNSQLLKEFGHRVFDLARSEATLPSGRVARFACEGTECLALSSGYTNDGGHLNDAGRLAAARDLLLFLSEQCK